MLVIACIIDMEDKLGMLVELKKKMSKQRYGKQQKIIWPMIINLFLKKITNEDRRNHL